MLLSALGLLKVPEGALQVPVVGSPFTVTVPAKVMVPPTQVSSEIPASTSGNLFTVISTSSNTAGQGAAAAMVKRRVMT